MSKIVRNIQESASPLRLEVPRDGLRSRESPLLYTEPDMSKAVQLATQRGREIAAQEAEAFVRQLDRSVECALEAVTQCLQGFESARRELLEITSGELMELALQVAQAVVGSEIAIRPESIQTVVDELLEELRDAEQVTVRLAPETMQSLRQRGGVMFDDRVRWVTDAGLGPSDARVDSDRGGWDAAVETRWRRISEAVRSARSQRVTAENRAAATAGDDGPGADSEEAAA